MADKDSIEAAPVAGGGEGVNPKLLMGMLGLNLVVMVVVVAILFLGQKKRENEQNIEQVTTGASASGEHGAPAGEHGAPAGEHGAPAAGAGPEVRFFSAGDFTANLSGPASTHYVKVNVNLELSKEADEEEMKKRKPQVRDRIISLLNGKKPSDLQTTDGRNFLKEEIKTVVNGLMQSGKIEGVYFSTFIIN